MPLAWAPYLFLPACLLFYYRRSRYLSLTLLTALWTLSPWQYTAPLTDEQHCHATLRVDNFPTPATPTGSRFIARIADQEDCPLKQHERLDVIDYSTQHYHIGDTIHAHLHLKPLTRSSYQQRERLRARASLQQTQILTAPTPWLLQQRAHISAHIDQTFPVAQRAWVSALLLGDRSHLDHYAQKTLQQSGTAHLIAISGLHLALIAAICFMLIRRALAYLPSPWRGNIQPHTLALLLTLIISLLYALLTGGAPPVMRAWFMLSCIVCCWFNPLLANSRQALKIAALCLLLLNPWQLGAAGGWLSFTAVAIILYSAPLWRTLRPLWQWPLLQALLTLGLIPLTWALFGGISLIAPIANLMLIPWMAPLLAFIILALLIPACATPAVWLLDRYLAALKILARPDWVYIQPYWQPTLTTALLLTAAYLMFLARYHPTYPFRSSKIPRLSVYLPITSVILAISISLITILVPPRNYYAPNGSAVLYQQNHTIIINSGYRNRHQPRDDASRYLLPELRHHYRKPNAIILTSRAVRDNSAVITLLQAYPDTPLYSTVVLADFPFTIIYCPTDNSAGISFHKSRMNCHATFAGLTIPLEQTAHTDEQ